MKILLLILVLYVHSFGTAGETGFELLEYDKTTYSLAQNGNDNLSSNPISGIFSNPASLSYLTKTGFINTNFSFQFIDTKAYSFTSGYSINYNQKVGLGVSINDYGIFNKTTIDNPYGTGETFSARDYHIQVSYSYKIMGKLVFGASPLFVYQKYENYSASAIGINLGALYYLDNYKISISAKNFGIQLKTLFDDENKTKLPYTGIIAFGNSEKERFNWEIDITKIYKQSMKFGFGGIYHINRTFSFYSGLTLSSERLSSFFDNNSISEYYFDESRIFSGGLEFSHKNFDLIFGIGYVGGNFSPLTSFALNYSF